MYEHSELVLFLQGQTQTAALRPQFLESFAKLGAVNRSTFFVH